MTDRKELEKLAGEMRKRGATVTIDHDRDGYISDITIAGAKGIGPHPMPPISAAERMREFLSKAENKTSPIDILAMKRDAEKFKKHLKDLTESVSGFLVRIDAHMKAPSTPERGRIIAKLCNELEMANDSARYFGLGVDYRKDKMART